MCTLGLRIRLRQKPRLDRIKINTQKGQIIMHHKLKCTNSSREEREKNRIGREEEEQGEKLNFIDRHTQIDDGYRYRYRQIQVWIQIWIQMIDIDMDRHTKLFIIRSWLTQKPWGANGVAQKSDSEGRRLMSSSKTGRKRELILPCSAFLFYPGFQWVG